MDQYILFYLLVILWITPFSFGANDKLNICMDTINHKNEPGPESALFQQCSPWKTRSCCTGNTSQSLHNPRHLNFNVNHCEKTKEMSKECLSHFVQDLCFYECSPNVGPWIVQVNMKIRKERFYGVPLCKSQCESWFSACRYDYTCSSNWLRGWNWTDAGNECRSNARCETFQNVFSNATNFCEKVWDGSYKVFPDEKPCMKLWFSETGDNPNDAVAKYYSSPSLNSCPQISKITKLLIPSLLLLLTVRLS